MLLLLMSSDDDLFSFTCIVLLKACSAGLSISLNDEKSYASGTVRPLLIRHGKMKMRVFFFSFEEIVNFLKWLENDFNC